MENLKTITSFKLENLSEFFEYHKNLNYKICLGDSTIDEIYLKIQSPKSSDSNVKVFKFDPSEQIFEYSKSYTNYVFKISDNFDNFKSLLKDFIEKLKDTSLKQRNQIFRENVDNFILLKNIVYTGAVSQTLIDEYNKSHYKASSDYVIQHFNIYQKRTVIYFDLKSKVYQFEKEITDEYTLTDLKNAFLKFINETIIDYEVRIDYNNDVIKHRDKTKQKLKLIYSEFFI